ncbi:FecR family protein [Dinghuibacter silviterrae]|uniref:FecR family protein n=1 Tax=Dinghuibacter silviterrae TaxID=1539049 RepID=A0A4R8DTJ8_9BACT|nr:FecR domain-containing protein [Dinghuibacter silviterrae]TDX00755.1 FecR family protein [Dinghuibacter silviterrae]
MPDKNLIRKYLDGLATEEETRAVMAYLAADDSDWQPLEACFAEVADPAPDVEGSVSLKEEVLSGLRQKLYPAVAGEPVRVYRWWRLAAAAAVLAAAVTTLLYYAHTRHDTEVAVVWKTLHNADVHTRLGVLPDGSQVYLSPHSTLSYPTDFVQHRALRLEGEAFFDVTRDDQHPFVVDAGPLSTQVLGTSFNIEAYGDEGTVRISLVQGRVAVRSDTMVRVLKAGEVLTYVRNAKTISMEELKMTNVHDWEDGYMLFNEVPVADALGRIAKRYGLSLDIQDPDGLRGKHVTGVFKQQPLAQTLDIVLFISRYKYRIKGNTLVVLPK